MAHTLVSASSRGRMFAVLDGKKELGYVVCNASVLTTKGQVSLWQAKRKLGRTAVYEDLGSAPTAEEAAVFF